MDYRIDIEKDGNAYTVSFPDLPWVHTFGQTKADAIARAADAFLTGVEFLIRQREAIPAAKAKGGTRLQVSALASSKIALHNAMVRENITRAELSRRLRTHRPQVDRLMKMRHGSTFEQIEAAFGALGQRLEISVSKG